MGDIQRYDVIIIGAGPAGSSTARVIARRGYRTLLVERKSRVGIPVLCGEFLPTVEELRDILPHSSRIDRICNISNSVVLNRCNHIVLVSPSGDEFDIPMRAIVIDRAAFDQHLAEQALKAGAILLTGTKLKDRVSKNQVRLISGSGTRIVECAVLVGADGPLSTVARCVPGLSQQETNDLSISIQYTIEATGFDSDRVFMFFGNIAPGGYAWIIPRGHTEANVGLGLRPSYATPRRSLRNYLHSFIHHYLIEKLGIRNIRIKRRISGFIPVNGPVQSTVTATALLVGDAASHVMPTNGGGIPTALIGGNIAGKAIVDYLKSGSKLSNYEEMWRREFGNELITGASLLSVASIPMLSDAVTEWAMRCFGRRMLNDVIRCRVPYPFQELSTPLNLMTGQLHRFLR